MNAFTHKILRHFTSALIIVLLLFGAVFTLAATVKPVRDGLHGMTKGTSLERFWPHDAADDHDEHDGHDHGEGSCSSAAPGQSVEIALSPTASKNIGLNDSSVIEIEPTDYYKSFSFPAVITERPGWSTITVPSPVSGVVTRIYHEAGIAVAPGDPLFDVLLNQQELVKAQTEFITLLKKKEINAAELQRINQIDPELIPKQHRELVYDKMQIEQGIALQRNILLLQGLKPDDVSESLEKKGEIIRNMTVFAPPMSKNNSIADNHENEQDDHTLTIDELFVTVGKNIAVGDSLCKLSDYCKLAIKGKVYAADEKELTKALNAKSRVSATFEGNGNRETVDGLQLRSIDNKIDTENGVLYCYVDLPNRFNGYEIDGEGASRRFAQWHFKPGQRCELSVEYEPLPDCIVLPVDAVAQDFQETSVFEWVGDEEGKKIWRKTPVHVIYRTKNIAVLANDGSVFPGAHVASKGAGFILAALDAANQKAAGGGGGGIQHGDHVH